MDAKNVNPRNLTAGQRAYEEKRAAKAGVSLEVWLRDKERRAAAEAAQKPQPGTAAPAAAPKKPGFFAKLLERAQKPL